MTFDPAAVGSIRDHTVVLYDDDRQFVRAVGEFAFDALAGGDAVVLFGSRAQLAAADEWIELSLDGPARPSALDRYVTIDAEAVADELVAAKQPAQAFDTLVSDACGAVDASTTLHIGGSLVEALWARGKPEVATAIEQFGNRLVDERGASILCAIPAAALSSRARRSVVESCHSAVLEAPAVRLVPGRSEAAPAGTQTAPSSAACIRTFPAAVPACRAARHFVRDILESTKSNDEVIDTIELICSELSANAVRHAHSAFTVALEYAPTHVRIAVADEMPPAPGEDDRFPVRTGRGLGIVAALARDWGVELDEHGHAVWAEVTEPPDGPSGADRWEDAGTGAYGTPPAPPNYGQPRYGQPRAEH